MNRLNVATGLTVLFLARVATPGWAASQRTREWLVVEKGSARRLAIVDPSHSTHGLDFAGRVASIGS
jgi:hypothetical protein